jgi:hypothetical protein
VDLWNDGVHVAPRLSVDTDIITHHFKPSITSKRLGVKDLAVFVGVLHNDIQMCILQIRVLLVDGRLRLVKRVLTFRLASLPHSVCFLRMKS